MDNELEFAMYNNNSLTITGDLTDWRKEKKISFESCDANDPGTLAIKGNIIQNCL